jgi:hypothetical protein
MMAWRECAELAAVVMVCLHGAAGTSPTGKHEGGRAE